MLFSEYFHFAESQILGARLILDDEISPGHGRVVTLNRYGPSGRRRPLVVNAKPRVEHVVAVMRYPVCVRELDGEIRQLRLDELDASSPPFTQNGT